MRSTSTALQDGRVVENVSQTAAVVAQQGGRAITSLWNMSKKAYVSVASTVETAARDSGYQINLGTKEVERTIAQQPSSSSDMYHSGGMGGASGQHRSASTSNLAGMGAQNGGDAHHFASGGWGAASDPGMDRLDQRSTYSGMDGNGYGSSGRASPAVMNNSNNTTGGDFAGFDHQANGVEGMGCLVLAGGGHPWSCSTSIHHAPHPTCADDDWSTWESPSKAAGGKPPTGRSVRSSGGRSGGRSVGGASQKSKWQDNNDTAPVADDDWGKW